ncbi:helix-turn-helix domain-containing protein [Lacinutrix iliipiscaria]|uniref:Helix-turn-helix domain-containing protein n=1 Tax=Lacinutrix iliipiscaria TaxID=1230532 RepID=A0ABW5WST6_9FLAO
MEFGEKFKLILKEKKVTQSKFAEDTNLHKGYVSRILNGESPSADFIMKAVGYFPDTDLYQLFFDRPSKNIVNEELSTYKLDSDPLIIINDIEDKLRSLKKIMTQKRHN